MKQQKAHFYLLGRKACKIYRNNQDKSVDRLVDLINDGSKKYGLAMYVDGSGNLDGFMIEVMGWDDFVCIERPIYRELKWRNDINILLEEEGI